MLPARAQAPAAAAAKPAAASPTAAAAWPRTLSFDNVALLVYAPQVTHWNDNVIEFRAALALKEPGGKGESYGVLTGSARTQVDRVSRTVALADLAITQVDFPLRADHGAGVAAKLKASLPATLRMVSLDRVLLSLAASGETRASVAVDNTPPRVLVSQTPAILVPIDGVPKMTDVPGAPGWQRVQNTRALILKSAAEPQYFLHVYDGWLMATSLDGPWTQPFLPPAGIDKVAKSVAATGAVELLAGGRRTKPRLTLAQGVPAIFTAQAPAALLVFDGAPDFAPLAGTALEWATNTRGDVLRDTASKQYYVLLAGRWFTAPALTGPWAFVRSDALPPDFARIPAMSLAGAVLPAVAGTPQARVAVIENSIPQTATVLLKGGPTFTARFDGDPQWEDVPGTSVAYARNTSVPVIRTAADAYYALRAGIWFRAAQATGPWSIATSVPAAIYAIPPSSPIFFVTFARIYGATADVVSMGYTPGYLGALVAPGGTVVYGTGYAYKPWLGRLWFPGPATYGVGATPVFNPRVGYTYAFAVGLGTPASALAADGVRLHPGYWGRYPCCANTGANVYRAWARAAAAGSPKVAARAAPPPTPAPAARVSGSAAPADASAEGPPATIATDAQVAQRGYDMSMVTTQDNPAVAGTARAGSTAAPTYISANAYYASLRKDGGWSAGAAGNHVYASAGGGVYRQSANGWQQQAPNGWQPTPAAPPEVDAEAQARARAEAAAQAAGSYGMSNDTRFTNAQGDGWSARDAGSGGYSRTLGGDGGISAEYRNYHDAVMNNAFDIAMNGGYWGESVPLGNSGVSLGVGIGEGPYMGPAGAFAGPGWGGRFGGP